MNENNNVNYGFDNTLCSVDIGSQVADGIDINRVCEEIDKSKIRWIDARKNENRNFLIRRGLGH